MSLYSKRQPRYVPVRGRRSEFATVERRRREYVGDASPAAVARPGAKLVRAGAATILASTSCVLFFAVVLSLSPQTDASNIGHRMQNVGARGVARLHLRDRAAKLAPAVATLASQTIGRARQTVHLVASAVQHREPMAIAMKPRALTGAENSPRALASSFSIEAAPWRLTADGTWVAQIVTSYTDAAGIQQPHPRAEVSFSVSPGESVDLDPWVNQTPAAAVTTRAGASVTVTAVSTSPAQGTATLTLPAPPNDPSTFAGVARAVGPHLIAVGWTPLAASAGVREYKVYKRASGAASGVLVAVVSPAGHAWRDARVVPGATYRYSIVAELGTTTVKASTTDVETPAAMPATSLDAIAGKGMFLFFSPDTSDPNSYERFDPDTVIAQAEKAGVSEIEVRMSRGTFFEAASPDVRAWLDRFIDAASAAGIKLLAWSVPRRNSSDDVTESVMMARYHTSAGNGFAGLALDLEPGANYMGYGEVARERMAGYMEMARQAVGPDYLLVATVISPRLTHWTNDEYPYSRIARYASAMQPMEYWHHFRDTRDYALADVSDACAGAVNLTRSLAGRKVPVNVAGQSSDLGRTGAPAPDELSSCLGGAKAAGAVGETFFSWQGTAADQWAAIEAYRW